MLPRPTPLPRPSAGRSPTLRPEKLPRFAGKDKAAHTLAVLGEHGLLEKGFEHKLILCPDILYLSMSPIETVCCFGRLIDNVNQGKAHLRVCASAT